MTIEIDRKLSTTEQALQYWRTNPRLNLVKKVVDDKFNILHPSDALIYDTLTSIAQIYPYYLTEEDMEFVRSAAKILVEKNSLLINSAYQLMTHMCDGFAATLEWGGDEINIDPEKAGQFRILAHGFSRLSESSKAA